MSTEPEEKSWGDRIREKNLNVYMFRDATLLGVGPNCMGGFRKRKLVKRYGGKTDAPDKT